MLTCGFFPQSTIVLRVEQIEQVVAVLLAEVGELRRVPRPRADVAALHVAGPKRSKKRSFTYFMMPSVPPLR